MNILPAAAGAIGTLAALVVVVLLIVYTGGYNIAATEEHASLTHWVLETTERKSVDRRAGGMAAPERFTAEMIATGASMYRETCQHCHAGPGVERAQWASGMRPRPPHLTEAAAEWGLAEVFWLTKHGIRMTGMPAFGPTHDDQTLWNVAAFVKQLPAMTREEYAGFRAPASHGDSSGSHAH